MTLTSQKAILANATTDRLIGNAIMRNSTFLKEILARNVLIVKQTGDAPNVIGIVLKVTHAKSAVVKNDLPKSNI